MKKSKKLMILGLSAATAAVAATGAVSSFAWFATNSEVAASGMSIKASTSQVLEIKKADATTWAYSASTGVAAKSLTPTYLAEKTTTVSGKPNAYSSGAAHTWVESTASASNKSASDGDYKDVTTAADATDDTNLYTLIADFDLRIRYVGDSTSSYTIKALVDWADTASTSDKQTITVDGTAKDYWLHNSARVFLVIGSAETVGSQGNGFTFSSASDGASGDWSDTATSIKTDLKASNDGADGLGKGIRVRAFFYFDGEDSNCFTDNATKTIVANTLYSFKLTFTATKNS